MTYEIKEEEIGSNGDNDDANLFYIGITLLNITEEWREGNIKILGKDSFDEIINGDILKTYPSKDCKFYN